MDRMTELEVFVAVVDQGGFTDAANKLRMSKSAVSKHIAALEARLSVTLLNRTTRRVSPTEVGLAFYEKSKGILENTRDAELMVQAQQSAPTGTLKISAPTEFGDNQLASALVPFLTEYPEVRVRMELDNRYVDIMAEEFDLAVRIGDLADSSLKARKIAMMKVGIVGSAAYFEKHGRPTKVDDLSDHKLLQYVSKNTDGFWRVPSPTGEIRQFAANSGLASNNGNSLLSAAKAGLGLAILPCFSYAKAVEKGCLEKVLSDLPFPEIGIHLVYPPANYTQPKLRVFIDFLADHFKGKGLENW